MGGALRAPSGTARERSADQPSDLPIAFGPVRWRRLGWSPGIKQRPTLGAVDGIQLDAASGSISSVRAGQGRLGR
jgi:hypothetical protein